MALDGLGHHFTGQVRGEFLDEIAHEPAQEGAATEADLGDAGLEQFAGIQRHQVAVELGIDRHLGHDAHTQAQAHVGLDDVGVGCGEHHLRRKATVIEGFVQLGAAGETEYVGHDRILGNRFQGQLRQLGQWMALRHHDTAIPFVARHHDQVAEQLQRLGGNGEIDSAVSGHLGDLHGRALMHVQGHFRVLLDEIADHRWQRITGLGVRGGDGQGALLLVGELLGDLLDAFDLAQDLAGGIDDALTRGGDTGQVLAATRKDFNTQFIFEQADLLADPRLRGIQTLRRRGDVEVVVRHFPDVAQLLKLHRFPSVQR
ncbi:hypothetical protein D3C79_572570 [compost metagenome]